MTFEGDPGQEAPGNQPPADRVPNSIRRGLEVLRGLALSVPDRFKSLLEQPDVPVLEPGPCQSDHSLAAALDTIGCSQSDRLATADPTFGAGLVRPES